MYLNILTSKLGFKVELYDSARRTLYADFSIGVKNSSIERYYFCNYYLTPMSFRFWSRYVVGLTYIWFKTHHGKGFFVDEDFEFM